MVRWFIVVMHTKVSPFSDDAATAVFVLPSTVDEAHTKVPEGGVTYPLKDKVILYPSKNLALEVAKSVLTNIQRGLW